MQLSQVTTLLDGKHNASFANTGSHLVELECAAETNGAVATVHPDEVAVLRLHVESSENDENVELDNHQVTEFPECCTFYIQKVDAEDHLNSSRVTINSLLECTKYYYVLH